MASEHSNRGAKRAREARADLGFTRDGPLPDLLDAIEGPGGAHVIVLALAEGVAGAYIERAGFPLLFVNGNQALSRQRFTAAHEFGHHRMGHSTVVDHQEAISGVLRHPNEICANAFAAEFLMPREAIAAWGSEHVSGAVTLEDVCALAASYGVSAHAARYALEHARVLTDEGLCAQLDGEIAENLHVELSQQLGLELITDELAETARRLPRIPAALRSSVLADFLAGQIDADGLAHRLQRDPDDVRAMLAAVGLDQLLPAPR
jgi:Zn-dependent peptidase ImmA (M78 family)